MLADEDTSLEPFLQATNYFADPHRSVIGVGFGITSVDVDDHKLKLQLWSPATQERFFYIRPLYYRGASTVILITRQDHLSNLSPFIREIITHLGPVPIELVLRCSSQFADVLEAHRVQLQAMGLNLSENPLHDPQDIYHHVGRSFLAQKQGHPYGISLHLFIDDNYPWNLVANPPEQDPRAWLAFLETQITLLRNWAVLNLCQNDFNTVLDESALMRQLEIYYGIIESIGATINPTHTNAVLENDLGVFNINLHNGSVSFIPGHCNSCSNSCKTSLSLCIVQRAPGWSSYELSSNQLLIIAKIYALKYQNLPKHVNDQMKKHPAYHCQAAPRKKS